MRFIYSKAFGIFAACLILITVLVFLQTKGFIEPLKRAILAAPRPVAQTVRNVTLPVKNFFLTIYQLTKIARENAFLKQKVLILEQNLVDYEKEKKDNEILRKELGFVQSTKLKLIPCTVLSANPFGVSDSIALSCGQKQGVKEGLAVISQGFMVGKIVYAGENVSTALLVTSSRFSTDARVSQSGAGAIARGSFGSGLILDQLSQNEKVEKGWLVVSGGIDENIPKNVLIGEIDQEISNPNDLFKKTTLLSPIDFNNLGFVFVVNK